MPDKKQPKIRIVSLSGKSPIKKGGNRADCECDNDTRQCACECETDQCACDSYSSSSSLQSKADEKKQQQSKKEKVNPKTFFKIAEKRK
jgi:hypothetical protein